MRASRLFVFLSSYLMLFMNGTAISAMSDNTSSIEGHLPTGVADVVLHHPDGSIVNENDYLDMNATVNDYLRSATVDIISVSDEDGDDVIDFNADINNSQAEMISLQSGSTLSGTDMDKRLEELFVTIQKLKFRFKYALNVSTSTGDPRVGVSYLNKELIVNSAAKPIVKASTGVGYLYGGFPLSGHRNAMFTIIADGANVANNVQYTWSSDQTWLSVTNGKVTLTRQPTDSDRTATILAKKGGSTLVRYRFTLARWFDYASGSFYLGGDPRWLDKNAAIAYCASKGAGWSIPADKEVRGDSISTYINPTVTGGESAGSVNEWGAIANTAGFNSYPGAVPLVPDSNYGGSTLSWSHDSIGGTLRVFQWGSSNALGVYRGGVPSPQPILATTTCVYRY